MIGGTGTLGSALTERLISSDNEIVCFSRDELKQQEMKLKFPGVRYIIGDIRDRESLKEAMDRVDVVFHVAALKHVDVIENNPVEAIKTNVLGTINVAEAAIEAGVSYLVFSSTDKAVLPINVYGMTKGISERYLLGLNKKQDWTKFAVYRWGNVLGSRGSVLHSFEKSLKESRGIKITDPRMTRFWIHIGDAVDYMLSTYRTASRNGAMIPPMRSAKVTDLARLLAAKLGLPVFNLSLVGIRPGEKIHEVLESTHDFCLRSDTCETYSDSELSALIDRVII